MDRTLVGSCVSPSTPIQAPPYRRGKEASGSLHIPVSELQSSSPELLSPNARHPWG